FILLTRSSQRFVEASPRAEGEAFVSASSVACSPAAAESHLSARKPSSWRRAAAPFTSFCASAVSWFLLLVAEPMAERTRRNDSRPTKATMRALTAMILIRIRPSDPPRTRDAARLAALLPRFGRRYHSAHERGNMPVGHPG